MAFVGATGLEEAQVIALLNLTARHVFWSGDLSETPELRSFLQDQTLAVTREDIVAPRLLGKLRLGFGGISADKIDGRYVNIMDGRFDPFVEEVVTGLKGILGNIVFGGTYWSFMPGLARVADKKARVTLTGVMPQQGLKDLLAVRHLFEGDDAVPKMDYLAVSGAAYTDPAYVSMMASAVDGFVSIGGRKGARKEVEAVIHAKKPAFLAPLEFGPDDAWISEEVLGGLTYTAATQDLIDLIRLDYRPPIGGINTPGLSFRQHVSPHTFRVTNHGDDFVVGVVSTSGATTDVHRLRRIMSPLLNGIDKSAVYPHKIIGLGGLTAMGGIHVFYEVCEEAAIDTAGIMPWKGTGHPLFRGAKEMIISGREWSEESPAFKKMIDILLVFEPGPQGWEEAQAVAREGGPLGQKIPIIVIRDPIFARGRPQHEIPGAQVFEVGQLDQAIQAINAALAFVKQQRRKTV